MSFTNSTADFEWHDEAVTYTEGTFGTDSTLTFTRRVRRKNGAAINIESDPDLMRLQSIIPSPMEGYNPLLTTISSRALGGMRCRNYSIRLDTPSKTCTVQINFANPAFVDDVISNKRILPSSTTYSAATRSVKLYRDTWVTAPPTLADSTGDIGGTAVGGAGATVSENIVQQKITVTAMQDASNPSTTMDALALSLLPYMGCINSQPFAGYPIGTVICESIQLRPVQMPYFEVSMELLWDEYAFHEQVAETGADGRVNWLGTNVKTVIWRRPPRTSQDFNGFFGTDTDYKNRTLRGFVS